MRKFFVYLVLSVILIVPIASIIAIAVINQPINSYSGYTAIYDYSSVQTQNVMIKDLIEVINCTGRLTSSKESYFIVKYKYDDTIIITAKENDYVYADDTLVIKNSEELSGDVEGKITYITNTGERIVFSISGPNVDTLQIALPARYYPYIEKSSAVFTVGGQEINAKFTSVTPAVDTLTNTFIAEYSVNENGLLLDAEIPISLMTGNVRRNVYVIPKACVYKDEFNKFYIETINDDWKNRIYIELGLMDETEVEISQMDKNVDNLIYEGLPITVNSIDIFIQEDSENTTNVDTEGK